MLRLMPHPLQFAFQSAGPLPARSLSCRLCRDASSPLPPSSDVGKFIRGAAFPTARAGLRRPQMRSAALFRPSDGFSARPGNDFRHAPAMSPPRAAGHSGSGNEPPVRSLSGRLCRDASSSRPPSPDVGKFIRGAAFPIARAGLRRPLMRSAVECSRPAALFRAPDGLSARPGMSPPRAAGGIPAPATNRPRGACPRHVAAPCGGGGIPAPATNRPRRTAPEVRRPRAPQLRPYSSPEAPSPSRCVPFARSAKFARAQPAAFARIMRYARPLRMFACSETAPHET